MGVALCATGFWIFLDVPWTPSAVVISVIIYNAAFGFRYAYSSSRYLTLLIMQFNSWGPIPWLYPPEV